MSEEIYRKLARVLDELPNGYPPTESGIEIKILKKIFKPDQAELFCDLTLAFETVEQIASRTGRPLEGLKERLMSMALDGQIFTIKIGPERMFRMLPWIFGIYEFQLGRIDRELAEMVEQYKDRFAREFFSIKPQIMQTLPVEVTIPFSQEAMPYEKVSNVIENGQSFLLNECICKKEKALVGHPCDRPLEVCLAIAPVPGMFDKSPTGRVVTREEAQALLEKSEELGLVHLAGNVKWGQYYICNCCKCCCGVLSAINELGIPASQVINSAFHAQINAEDCTGCGICADERCQVGAIEETADAYRVVEERCIGCGLCVRACPTEAIRIVRRAPDKMTPPPDTEYDWFKERARIRGLDYAKYIPE